MRLCSVYFSFPHATGRFCELAEGHSGQHRWTVPRWITEIPGGPSKMTEYLKTKTQVEIVEMYSQPIDTVFQG